MLKWKSLVTIVVTVGVVALLAVHAQPKNTKESTLTALDYAEIQQLNAHYANAFDSCADKGREWASLFTPDGVFMIGSTRKFEGREALATYAGSPRYCDPPKSALTINHVSANVMIEPSREGAIGKSYLLRVNFGQDGKGEISEAGKYYDVYVKTAEGWRFKSRKYVMGQDVSLIPESELSHHPLSTAH
jgi:hypothetical protein